MSGDEKRLFVILAARVSALLIGFLLVRVLVQPLWWWIT